MNDVPQTTDAQQVALILRKVLITLNHHTELLTRLANNMNQRLQAIEEREQWVDHFRHVPPPPEYRNLPPPH